MQIAYDDLTNYRQQVAMVDGGFDPLHLGHIAYFKAAAALGLPVLCCIAPDDYVASKHRLLLNQEQRLGIVDAIRYIDYVTINVTTTADILRKLQPRLYVKGKDWENRLPQEETSVCADHNIEMVFLDTVIDSSSRILKNYQYRQG